MLFQGRPAWVLLSYGSKRVSDTGGHDPRTGFLPSLTGTVVMMWRLWGNDYVHENSAKSRNTTKYLNEKVTTVS